MAVVRYRIGFLDTRSRIPKGDIDVERVWGYIFSKQAYKFGILALL